MRKQGGKAKKGVRFNAELDELKSSTIYYDERQPTKSQGKDTPFGWTRSALELPLTVSGVEVEEKTSRISEEQMLCKVEVFERTLELAEIKDDADAGCSTCSVVLEATRLVLGPDPPWNAIITPKFWGHGDRGRGVKVTVNGESKEFELFVQSGKSSNHWYACYLSCRLFRKEC